MPFHQRYKRSITPIKKGEDIDYKNLDIINRYIDPETGKIVPGRVSGNKAKDQRKLSTHIQYARYLALLPYTDRH